MAFSYMDSDSFLDIDFVEEIETDGEEKVGQTQMESIAILPLKNTVLFPGVVIPITVGRDKSIQLVKEANKTPQRLLGVVTQRNIEEESPKSENMFRVGTLAKILKMIRMPDGSITIVIQGRKKIKVDEYVTELPYFKANIHLSEDEAPSTDKEKALILSLREQASEIIDLSPHIPSEAKIALDNIETLNFLIHFIASNLHLEVNEKQEILELESLDEKGELVLRHLSEELRVLEVSEEIQTRVRQDMDEQQREYILRQQIKTIQDELGDAADDSEIEKFKAKAAEKDWPEEVQEVFDKEIKRLGRLMPNMPDYGIVINYLERLLDLPWGNYSTDDFDFGFVQDVLDEDHFGLEKVKERILEHLAVLKLKTDKKAPILCFLGPPGVGKTSLGKSIARALQKDFVRISLGGVHDEAEIRGHRRTYIGAMPGRIIQGFKRCKTSNPVFILDEIDKVGSNQRGDPASALLEVLDPEQNSTYRDNFLEVEYDLSRVMFIATANSLNSVHPALRDRMEIIQLNSYSVEEKLEIAKRHLVPQSKKEHGLKSAQLSISPKALQMIAENYTRESGVRQLRQKIDAVCRGAAKGIVIDGKDKIKVNPKNLSDFLGVKRFENEKYAKVDAPGVAIGLAWTRVGGDILFIEASLSKGSGRLSMTGRLGEVMRESATLAHTWLKSNCEKLDIPSEVFKKWDVHVHIPAGGIPKDGPSAGITMLSALASLFTQKQVRPQLAMTGEITLRGKVLPVGGIKEKVLAASRAGITRIIMCKDNEKDVSEIDQRYLKDVKFEYVDNMLDVLKLSLEKEQVENPKELIIKKKDDVGY